ncbi:unnamed protein product [Sphagnum balticum]
MFKFKNRKSQEIFDSVIAEFDEKQVSIEILCLDPKTKVLTADLRWVCLDDVKVGDELVACDEGETIEARRNRTTKAAGNREKGIYSPKVAGKKHTVRERKMRTTVVEAKWDTFSTALEITFEDGRKITCSPDHKFLYKQRGGSDPIWGYAKKMRIGDKIRSITKTWGESTYEDGWFGGFIDGEGSMSKPSTPGVEINVAQRFNVALERARKYLTERGYGFRQEIDNRSATPAGKLGKDAVAKLCVSRSDEIFNLIGQTRPSRFIGRRWWEGKSLPGKRSSGENTWAVISSIKVVPAQRLVDIQTSTGTFVAEGLVTHNCLKARQLGVTTKVALKFKHRLMFIPNTQAIMASVQKERSELIKRIMDTAYSHCPWWLVPTVIAKNRYDNGSILSIQSGSQAMGLAQGWTPTSIHLCLSPDTLIHLQNGEIKPIKDVVMGDSVITSKRRLAKVKAVVKSHRENEVATELSLWGNYSPLVVTRDHPILTPEGFVPAEDIGKHDFVVMPVRPITRSMKTVMLLHNQRTKPSPNKPPTSQTVKLDDKWGWMCGLYLAEGSAHYSSRLKGIQWDRTIFCVHEKEIERTRVGLGAALGMFQGVRISTRLGTKSSTLTVNNAGLSRWLVENFGHLADGKKIPDWVFSAGEEFVNGLLRGYFEGDGHIPDNTPSITGCSISMPLLIQIRELLASSGFGWSCIYHANAGVRYGRNCRERWQLQLNGDYARRLRAAMGWILVEKKKRAVECAEFYDLEVDAPEHDFCTIHCCVKNSELADYPNPQKMIEEGLFRATHSSRNLFMVLEGTGGGNTGWLADTWRTAKADYPLGKSRLCPIFIPWAMCPDIYPEHDWLRKFPVPEGFKPHEVTRKHVIKCESFIRNTPYLSKVAGRDWKMPIEQVHFWQFNYDTACKTHTQKTWAAQMPADDFEALTGIHDSVFDETVLSEIEEQIYEVRTVGGTTVKERVVPVQAYAIVGHDVDDAFYPDPDLIDRTKESITVEWKSFRGNEYEWTMLPLKPMDESVEMNTMDRLMVYEPPQRGFYYSCGVDTADGLGTEDEGWAVNGGWYIPKSKWLIEELRTLERHEATGKSKMEHRQGQHDDRVRAAAQSYFTAHDFDVLTERSQQRSAPPKKKERPKGPGTANQMAVAEDW